jgi:uncharacterized protein
MLHLQDLAKQGQHNRTVTISDRLPPFIVAPCHLDVRYQIEAKDNFYLVDLHVKGPLIVTCQRCLQEFSLAYENSTTIAVARSDERAEQLLELYECIVSSNWQIDLEDLVSDDLHLYVPQFHNDINDCDQDINQFLGSVNVATTMVIPD